MTARILPSRPPKAAHGPKVEPNAVAITMSPEDWHRVPAFPRQRNTKEHGAKILKVIKDVRPTSLNRVAAVAFPGGDLVKVNGHSRDYLWSEKLLSPAPDRLIVDIFHVKDWEEAHEVFNGFDNRASVHTSRDILYGLATEAGWAAESRYMQSGTFQTSLMLAQQINGADPDDTRPLLQQWLTELQNADRVMASAQDSMDRTSIHAGVVGAMLLCLREDSKSAMEFWAAYFNVDTRETVSQAVTLYNWLVKRRNSGKANGRNNTKLICNAALHIYQAYKDGEEVDKVSTAPLPVKLAA